MLKHKDILDKLDTKQKIALIASVKAIGNPWAEQAGIPVVKTADGTVFSKKYPAFSALANSWNTELIRDCSRDSAETAREKGEGLFLLNHVGVKPTPQGKGLSEDPYLCGEFINAAAEGVQSAGVMPCVSEFIDIKESAGISERDYSARTIEEIYLAPIRRLPQSGISYCQPTKDLSDSAAEAIVETLQDKIGKSGYFIDNRIESLALGAILSEGDEARILDLYEKGKDRTGGSEAIGEILSDTVLNEMADKVIDFAINCSVTDKKETETGSDELALRAAEESVVLLKNNNLLPFARKTRLAFIGLSEAEREAFSRAALTSDHCFEFECAKEEFSLLKGRNIDSIASLRRMIRTAQAVVLFLGENTGKDGKIGEIGFAGFQEWIDKVRKINPNIVAVIPADGSLDVSFAFGVSALLFADWKTSCGAQAIVNILSGKTCPSGKLAYSLYENTAEMCAREKRNQKAGLIKVGPFTGYRGYDTAKNYPPFSFGYGLSYTEFAYSDMTVSGDHVEFTVSNKGKYDGAEIVQLYIGKVDSSLLRPYKQLVGFSKVFLRAGEKKRVSLSVDPASFAVWNHGRLSVEKGFYDFFLASSVQDAALRVRVEIDGEEIAPDNEIIEDYLPQFSNILAENFTFGQVKKKAVEIVPGRKMMNTGVALSASALFFAVVALILQLTETIDLMYLESDFEMFVSICCVCVLPQTFLVGLGLLIAGNCVNKRYFVKRRKRILSAPTSYTPCEIQPERSYEELFQQAFQEENDEIKSEEESLQKEREVHVYCDKNLTFSAVSDNLTEFFKERGLEVKRSAVRNLFSAMSAFRLIAVRNLSEKILPRLCHIMSEYFGGEILLRDASQNDNFEAYIEEVMASASENRMQIRFSVWYNADAENTRHVLGKFAEYVHSPLTSEGDSGGYPPNVWFFFVYKQDNQKLPADLPFVTVDMEVSECEESKEKTTTVLLNYPQFTLMIAEARKQYCLDEEKYWKKVDKLEQYISSVTGKEFGNPVWSALEKYTSVYCACGGAPTDSLDLALASAVIPSIYCALADKGVPIKEISNKISEIFGAEACGECKKALIRSAGGNDGAQRS